MYKEWLVKRVTSEEAISDFDKEWAWRPELKQTPQYAKLVEYLNSVPDDCELWYFHSGRNSFVSLSGRAGYCIVKDGEIVSRYITVLS